MFALTAEQHAGLILLGWEETFTNACWYHPEDHAWLSWQLTDRRWRLLHVLRGYNRHGDDPLALAIAYHQQFVGTNNESPTR